MTSFNFYEAYAAVYNEELREDLLSVQEDFEFVDSLSDNELDEIMEEILSEGEVTLTESVEIFEELIMELNPYAPAGSKEARAYAKSTTKTKRSAAASERRAARVERIKGAAKRAGEAVKSRASEMKKSAVAGAKEVKSKVTGKLAAAKERIKSAVKSGRSAVAGGLRKAASKIEPKETEKKGKEVKAAARKAISGTATRKALPPVGTSKSGKTLTQSQRNMQTAQQNRKLAARLGEDIDLLSVAILEDLISEGHAEDFDSAIIILESLSDFEVGEIAESYLVEEVETVDLYDVVLEYLLDEGYADTEEAATVIMANMSEEWRQEILDEEPKGLPFGPVGKGFRKIPAGRQRQAMMKREKDLTKKAMSDRDNLYGGEATGSNRTKMGRIDSALTNPRLRP